MVSKSHSNELKKHVVMLQTDVRENYLGGGGGGGVSMVKAGCLY